MRTTRLLLLVGGMLGMVLGGCERREAEAPAREAAVGAHAVEVATVTLKPGHCAGVIVEDGHHALTAAHCVGLFEQRVELELYDGRTLAGRYVHVDPERDVAVIHLDDEAPVRPLAVAERLPAPGDALLFTGRNDRPGGPQSVRLRKLGRCPSLPSVPQALFTTLHGEKGDSGAPVVDAGTRVVGLVHGGAACSIAAPTAGFGEVVRRLAAREARESSEMANKVGVPGAAHPR
ncbi:trypsin-like peptidase domain-containing protein [Myxococcaceae bacterium GXIMD 01537]